MNPNFQLNVDSYKINTWLEERKKMPKDWQLSLKASDAKIQALLQDPLLKDYPEINKLIHDHKQYFSYDNVLTVCKILQKSKLASEKNFIGQYTNSTLKGWIALRSYMKKNIVGLLYNARLMNQVLKFQPGLKKNKEILRNQIIMFRRKIDSNNNSIYQNKINFASECKKYNIKGENIREEIPKLVEEIPSIFKSIESQCDGSVLDMIKLYFSFCRVNGSKQPSLEILQYFCHNGDDVLEIYAKNITQDIQIMRSKKYDSFKYTSNKEWEIEVQGIQSLAAQKSQTILTKRSSRLQIINSLNQLFYFYQMLEQELKAGDTHLLSSEYLKIQPSQQLMKQYIGKLKAILDLLNSPHFNELIGLYEHPQSAQRICNKLELYSMTSKRFQEQSERLLQKIKEIEGAISETEKQISKLKRVIEEAKKVSEEQLSALMKKEVRLVGDINKVQLQY